MDDEEEISFPHFTIQDWVDALDELVELIEIVEQRKSPDEG